VITNDKQILVCEMEHKRQKNGITHDIGAGGGVPSGQDIEQAVRDELYEELGATGTLTKIATWTPACGIRCLNDHYMIVTDINHDFHSRDGTYVNFSWKTYESLMEMKHMIRDDPFEFAKDFLHKF